MAIEKQKVDLQKGGRDPAGSTSRGEVPPLLEIEQDLRALIKSCGVLRHERDEARKKGYEDAKRILLEFIEVVDNFENVLRNIKAMMDEREPKNKATLSSLGAIGKLFTRALKSVDVVPIEILIGEKANPHFHSVTEVEANIGLETETVTEIIRKGYLWRGKLLRAAEVKAVRNR